MQAWAAGVVMGAVGIVIAAALYLARRIELL